MSHKRRSSPHFGRGVASSSSVAPSSSSTTVASSSSSSSSKSSSSRSTRPSSSSISKMTFVRHTSAAKRGRKHHVQTVLPSSRSSSATRPAPSISVRVSTPVATSASSSSSSSSSARALPANASLCGRPKERSAASREGGLLDMDCFYCSEQLLLCQLFVICGTCWSFVSCNDCWTSTKPHTGACQRDMAWHLARKDCAMFTDLIRPEEMRRYVNLEYHTFDQDHASCDCEPIGYYLTTWQAYVEACADEESEEESEEKDKEEGKENERDEENDEDEGEEDDEQENVVSQLY